LDATRLTACTFDCYGTLIDWEGGLGSFLYDYALRNRDDAARKRRELRERWEAIQFEVIQGDYRPYRDVLAAKPEATGQGARLAPTTTRTARRWRAPCAAGSRSRTPPRP